MRWLVPFPSFEHQPAGERRRQISLAVVAIGCLMMDFRLMLRLLAAADEIHAVQQISCLPARSPFFWSSSLISSIRGVFFASDSFEQIWWLKNELHKREARKIANLSAKKTNAKRIRAQFLINLPTSSPTSPHLHITNHIASVGASRQRQSRQMTNEQRFFAFPYITLKFCGKTFFGTKNGSFKQIF